jgi:hypothetical protein
VVTYLTLEAGDLRAHLEPSWIHALPRAHLEPSWIHALPADNVRAEQTTSKEER